MRGIKDFNFPLFDFVAETYRLQGYVVFNPAEKDREVYGEDFFKGDGSLVGAHQRGFSLRKALSLDLTWICQNADEIIMLPGWERSSGAEAEWMLARALGLKINYWVP